MNAHFATWRQQSFQTLTALQVGCHPKNIISQLAESLLVHYVGQPLIDPYAVYQHLMDYWVEVMQDDCYLIAAEGWQVATYRLIEQDKKGKAKDKGWSCDLIPKVLIVKRYFAPAQAAIEQLAAELEGVTAKLAELEEEHTGEDGAFAELDKVNKATVSARLKEIKGDKEAKAEAKVLNAWLDLSNQEAELKKQLKAAELELDAQAYAQYPKLSEVEIKALVVDAKWLAVLDTAIHSEMERVSQQLTARVKELAERYEMPLPQLTQQVAVLESQVNQHLAKMGFTWQ